MVKKVSMVNEHDEKSEHGEKKWSWLKKVSMVKKIYPARKGNTRKNLQAIPGYKNVTFAEATDDEEFITTLKEGPKPSSSLDGESLVSSSGVDTETSSEQLRSSKVTPSETSSEQLRSSKLCPFPSFPGGLSVFLMAFSISSQWRCTMCYENGFGVSPSETCCSTSSISAYVTQLIIFNPISMSSLMSSRIRSSSAGVSILSPLIVSEAMVLWK